MRLINPSVELIIQEPGLQGIYKQIEQAARVCYKSEDKICEGSAKRMVDMLIKNEHGAMLEHGTVYLAMPMESAFPISANGWGRYVNNKYSKGGIVCPSEDGKGVAVTTNYRVLVENGWLNDLQYLCEPTKYHEKRYTFKFTTNIGISREFNRHRVNSIAEESTRFCGYNKDKFGNEITYIQPQQFTQKDIDDNMYGKSNMDTLMALCQMICIREDLGFQDVDYWIFAMLASEFSYMGLISCGWKPQDARSVLNLNTKTELVHTAYESDWKHFCELRGAKNAHPEAQYLANEIRKKLDKI